MFQFPAVNGPRWLQGCLLGTLSGRADSHTFKFTQDEVMMETGMVLGRKKRDYRR